MLLERVKDCSWRRVRRQSAVRVVEFAPGDRQSLCEAFSGETTQEAKEEYTPITLRNLK